MRIVTTDLWDMYTDIDFSYAHAGAEKSALADVAVELDLMPYAQLPRRVTRPIK